MAWTFVIQSGAMLRPDGSQIGTGYSGKGQFKNDPEAEALQGRGPIPKGLYYIGKPVDTKTHGPHVLPLTPSPANTMFGRSGFLIHGDSIVDPGNASEGCVIMPLFIREAISSSDDMTLAVIES